MYKLIGWVPPIKPDWNGYSFAVRLELKFAQKAINFIRPKEDLNRRIRELLKPIGMDDYPSSSILFYEDMVLATNFTVAGNACGLDINRMYDIDELLKPQPIMFGLDYNTHNCDTMKQAYALLTAFSIWYEFAESVMFY